MNVNIELIGKGIVGTVKTVLMVTTIMFMLTAGTVLINVSNTLDRMSILGIMLHHNQLGGKHGTVQPDQRGHKGGGSGSGNWRYKKNTMPILPSDSREELINKQTT